MHPDYRTRLLREATEDPSLLLKRQKFWKLEWWPYYLRRCDDLVFGDPVAGLEFSKYAPELAAKIAAASPTANGADLMIEGLSYSGSAHRRADDYDNAETLFRRAKRYRDSASPMALAEHLRRLAYLRIFQKDPDCFPIVGQAIEIHKRGNLVNRHPLGECFICRGRAYVMFDQQGRSFDDYTAALNHVSLKVDFKPWYCALHCLAVWAVDHGTEEQIAVAYENLKPAMAILSTFWSRKFAKLKLRWLMAILDVRQGHPGRAEIVMLEVKDGLVELGLGFEVGMLQVDLANLYLQTEQFERLEALVDDTADIFRGLKVEAKAQEVLELWSKAEQVDADLLKRLRVQFADHAQPIPEGINV